MLFWAEESLRGSIGADSVISYDCVACPDGPDEMLQTMMEDQTWR